MEQKSTIILLFGDQVDTWDNDFAQVCERAAYTPWLRDYLADLCTCFSTEIRASQFDESLHQRLGSFTSLTELADQYRLNEDEVGVAQCLLLHAVRSSTLLELVKRNPHYLQTERAIEWLGISGGLVTLSAAAVAESFDQLREASFVIARLFVRLCKVTTVRSQAVESGPGSFGWVILGLGSNELQKALTLFQSSMGIPTHKLAQVAVTGFGWSSVIGPPSVLELIMKQCSAIKHLTKNPLNIHALQHTLNLGDSELDFIVGRDAAWIDKPVRDPPICLWGMDKPAKVYTSWGEMLRSICAQVLSKPLDIPAVIDELGGHLGDVKRLEIIQVGATSQAPPITTALRSKSRQVDLHDGKVLLASSPAAKARCDNRIAIVGASGRGPGCANRDELWERIMAKEDMCAEIPKDRFDIDSFYCPDHGIGKCSMNTRFGCFMANPGHFDSQFFHISPREAMLMDPGHRQFLMSVYEALEDAGYSEGQAAPTVDPTRIATFYGQVTDDWHDHTHPALGCDAYTLQGVQRAFGSGRVAWQFKWEGPTYSLDSACASSTAGIHMACISLRERDIDMAVVGAANILCYPHSFACLSKAGVLSPTGNCKTFRDDADGYCRADFAGTVVLKRLDDAIAHNDNILAVVAGSGRNHSGNSRSMTTSDAGAQERLFRKVLNRAHVYPDQVSYVEMHGTGTQTGDPAEVTAVSNVFKRRKTQLGPIPVGSSKANFGHSESAAGLVSLLKCIKMYETDIIPPQAGMPHSLNPKFRPLEELGIEIPDEAVRLPRRGPLDPARRILLNNFDAAGGNACLLLEDYKAPEEHKSADPRPRHVVVISARTQSAQLGNCNRLLTWLRVNPTVSLADLAYTTTARRMHHPLRLAFSVSSTDELVRLLEKTIQRSLPKPEYRSHATTTFVFSGQGSHFDGMGGHLYSTSPVFRENVDLCTNICREHGFPDFVDLITNGRSLGHDPARASTLQTQLAVVTLQIALAAFWSSVGVRPSLVIGHSLGEFAAMHVAGVLSLADVLYLVGKRAQLLVQQCAPNEFGMLAVRMTATAVESLIQSQPQLSSCTIACYNTAEDTVVSGSRDAITALRDQLGPRSRLLNVPYAFHSFQMDQVASAFIAVASGLVFSAPKIPVSSTLHGTVVYTGDIFNARYLARQMREPVNFTQAVFAAWALDKGDVWLELGPRDECSSFVRKMLRMDRILPTLSSTQPDNDWENISKALATLYMHGTAIDWTSLHGPYANNLTLITLPSYSWDVRDYWMAYTEPERPHADEVQVNSKFSGIFSCAQYIIEHSTSPSEIRLSMGASLADPQFHRVLHGHTMQGQPICAGSVFCEAAIATAAQMLKNNNRAADAQLVKLGLRSPVMTRPLTSHVVGTDGQLITTVALENASPNHIHVVWQASAAGSRDILDLGRCTLIVRAGVEDEQATWDRMAHYIKSCADNVVRLAQDGMGHRFKHEVFYSIFSSTVQYDIKYRCVQEAFVAEDFSEAVAEVVLQEDPPDARFVASPYWGEALVHIAGFIVNIDPHIAPQYCFVNSGFSRFDQTITFRPGARYRSYVRKTKKSEEKQVLDLFVFDGVRIVMQCLGLSFHHVSKSSFARTLGGGAVPSSAKPPPLAQENEPLVPHKDLDSPIPDHIQQDHIIEQISGRPPPSSSFQWIIRVLAEETGISRSDLVDDVALGDIGVDSIMSIEVATKISEGTGLEMLPSFVFDYPTIGDLRCAFDKAETPTINEGSSKTKTKDATRQSRNDSFTPVSGLQVLQHTVRKHEETQQESNYTPLVEHNMMAAPTATASDSTLTVPNPSTSPGPDPQKIKPEAKIILLKGSTRKNKQPPLYMIADGTGNIATYLHLIPALTSTMPIYGVNSPFLRCTEQFTAEVGIEGVAKYIVQALLTKHYSEPNRDSTPIWLAGYSGGAMLAYEVVRQLEQNHGIVVARLLLVDMVAPRTSRLANDDAIGWSLYDAVTRAEGDGNIWDLSDSTRDHLRACFTAVASYDPPVPAQTPFPGMRTAIIWARRGLIDRCSHDESLLELLRRSGVTTIPYDGFMEDPGLGSVMWSLPHKREQDVGTNGWERRLGGELQCSSVEADHLQMLAPDFVTDLAKKIEDILRWFEQ